MQTGVGRAVRRPSRRLRGRKGTVMDRRSRQPRMKSGELKLPEPGSRFKSPCSSNFGSFEDLIVFDYVMIILIISTS